jgi:glycosyltransferase involved in cell wall biosynthesis
MRESTDTPLRIVHLHWAYPPTTGGVESHLAELARAQVEGGNDVTVLTGESQPQAGNGFAVLHCPALELERARCVGGTPDYALLVRRELVSRLDRDVDIVHGHNLHHFAPEPALVLDDLRHELGFRLHHTFHETWPDVLHERPVYRAWDSNYAVSRFVQDECAARLGFRPDLLPLGIDTDRFSAAKSFPAGRTTPIVVHPARLLPWKGVHVSVRAVDELRTRGVAVRLVLTDTQQIADWNRELAAYRREIVELVDELELDCVELRPVTFEDMPRLYAEADLIVYPTVGNEPYGLVPLEAMSSARAIVASRSGGIAETIVDGQTGFLVDPGDHHGLADRLEELVRLPARARELGRAGRARVLELYDLRMYAARLARRYVGSSPAATPTV